MNVKDLIAELQHLPPGAVVVMSKDGEGNGYSPLSSAYLGSYVAETTWSGEWDDEMLLRGTPAVCLWPVN